MGVSRRHFSISYDEQVSNALRESTDSIVVDSLILEDLNPVNKTVVIRRDRVSETLFGGMEYVEKGSKTLILPGDLILVGGGTQPVPGKEGWINHQTRGIGLIYLGERRFVKIIVGEKGSDLMADLLALTDPTALENYINRQGIFADKNSILAGEEIDDPVVIQALKVVERHERNLEAQWGYHQEQIKNMEVQNLFGLLGNSSVLEEPEIVGYALLTALRIGGYEQVDHILTSAKVWNKLPGTYVLLALDYVEAADITDERKLELLNTAYMSRDDDIKLLIRERIVRYETKDTT